MEEEEEEEEEEGGIRRVTMTRGGLIMNERDNKGLRGIGYQNNGEVSHMVIRFMVKNDQNCQNDPLMLKEVRARIFHHGDGHYTPGKLPKAHILDVFCVWNHFWCYSTFHYTLINKQLNIKQTYFNRMYPKKKFAPDKIFHYPNMHSQVTCHSSVD